MHYGDILSSVGVLGVELHFDRVENKVARVV